MRNRFAWLVSLWLILVTCQAQAFSSMYVFGDSLSDTGNNAALFDSIFPPVQPRTTPPYKVSGSDEPLVPTFPYPGSNNYSNGPVWVDYLSSALGLGAATPFAAGGTNFAFGGARTGNLGLTDDPGLTPSLIAQAGFATHSGATPLPSDALYVVWGGGNDVRAIAEQLSGDLTATTTSIGLGTLNLATTIGMLSDAGARHFLVANVPDIGITPIARFLDAHGQPGAMALGTLLSSTYNQQLDAMLGALALPGGSTLAEIDIFAFNHAVLANAPPGYNATEACTSQNDFNGCSDPANFLYWDGVHPTTASHLAIAGLAFNALNTSAVPVPAGLPLATVGVVALFGVARRRRAA